MGTVRKLAIVAGLAVLCGHNAKAIEATWDYAVQLNARVEITPPRIYLSWPQDTQSVPSSYTVYRKSLEATNWGSGTRLPGNTTTYVDTNVSLGFAYEYQVVKSATAYTGYGYIYAGIQAPLIEHRGHILLLVDNTFSSSLGPELARLQQDITGDGWTVIRCDVSRTDLPTNVKAFIKREYTATRDLKAVFLFGHVPVPYSGSLVPDGHYPDHQGAWACDAYYADMDGNWTDTTVHNTNASDARNRNVPGDGKFDQSDIPSPVELQIGRVDLANMPGKEKWDGPATFPSELELLRNYLNKDHTWRHKRTSVPSRGLIYDDFGIRGGEAFAASGYRNLSALVGSTNVTTLTNQGTWITALQNSSYLWAYGCGAGSYSSIGGLGSTGQFKDGTTLEVVKGDIKAPFTIVMGSWLGDWDSEDNFMRAILATPSLGLSCSWSGRPHWYYHHVGLGLPLGHAAKLAQNNSGPGLYRTHVNSAAGQVHIALIGDPTLRIHPVAPPSSAVATILSTGSAALKWSASSDAVEGYHVYRSANTAGPFTRLTANLLKDTTFTDAAAIPGATYMVRAVKLENTPSGSYYNPSQGAFTTLAAGPATAAGTATNSTSGADIFITPTGPVSPPSPRTNAAPSTGTQAPVQTSANLSVQPSTAVTAASTLPAGTIAWVDDDLPGGAVPAAEGGDAWTWVTADPTPFSGTRSHQSALNPGMHQHLFNWAGASLTLDPGDYLFAYVYLDPANPPTEVMLQWTDGNWGHRAYWGANHLTLGDNGTVERYYAGPLPSAGQWARLDVPAAKVGLGGRTIKGMAFTLFGGRATWDFAGKSSQSGIVVTTPTTPAPPPTPDNPTTPAPSTNVASVGSALWIDDGLPSGAVAGASGGDKWDWAQTEPSPFAGTRAFHSTAANGLHQLYFDWATVALPIAEGDKLFAHVYLDPESPPTEVMLQWTDGSWEHRAYWGQNQISYGANGTAGRRAMGSLPAAGKWVRLEADARDVGLAGRSVRGMSFSLFGGRASWDAAGKTSVTNTSNPSPGTSTNIENDIAWVDDALPAGATSGGEGGDSWNWITSNPTPYAGSRAHQSSTGGGLHQHYFNWAEEPLSVSEGDYLFAYVYLDPQKTPSEVMLQWNDGDWDHRAFWGANNIRFGSSGSASRRYMGPLPPAGQWVRLEVPASLVGLEGRDVQGMSFSLFDGRATWDLAGKSTNPGGSTPAPDVVVVTNTPNPTVTNIVTTPPPQTNTIPISTNNGTALVSIADYTNLQLPKPGDHTLHVISPTVLELKLITAKDPDPDPAPVNMWNFVDSNFQFNAPSLQEFAVTVNGQSVAVRTVGFRRRPLYAPLAKRDLRVENALILTLASPVTVSQKVEVKNPSGALWSATMQFSATADPLRYSPAIHVNQEGYMPQFPKKAMVGYYLGSLGELPVDVSAGFKLVSVATGASVYEGTLKLRNDVGYSYTPTPYQQVFEADFTAFTIAGEYRLVVPGLGASLPFLIHDGIAMDFARTYALGLYHQRCGTSNAAPFARHTHDACHLLEAEVPVPQSSFAFTWSKLAEKNADYANEPRHTARRLADEASQLYPFVNKGKIDISGGHHDAGDYSKYTINSAALTHYLTFAVDSFSGVTALDNLGLPESGDGIPDILQEAKWEADFLQKFQDADGGFYFLCYPRDRAYENNVLPDQGDSQVVWPKNTAVTAAAVAALAQCSSSPHFKQYYPAEAAVYLQKAKLGWQFLMNAIAKYGKDGSYQKITHYGNEFMHDDELAWAACEMFLATGDEQYHAKLKEWFDPASPATLRWGWWRMWDAYGRAIRSYAFAARNGRVQPSKLDATFLAKCEEQVKLAAQDATSRAQQNAYGTSFPLQSKSYKVAGWYFSSERAFDITVGYQLEQRPEFIEAIISNLNFEGGCNPVNASYVTGLGWKRQREVVHQYAQNDRRVLPPGGMPLGNIQDGFAYIEPYKRELSNLTFPYDGAATAPYPFYDRWADTFNVSTEFVHTDTARSLASLAFLATGKILVSNEAAINTPRTATLEVTGMDLNGARIVWEAAGHEPAYGPSYTVTPTNHGTFWIEAEAQWPDGRRVFAVVDAAATNSLPIVSVAATKAAASELGPVPGTFTFTRTGSTDQPLTLALQFTGTAVKWFDYRRLQGDMPSSIVIPAGSASVNVDIYPVIDSIVEGTEIAIVTIAPNPGVYNLSQSKTATISITEGPL
jgi:hypothetical protein